MDGGRDKGVGEVCVASLYLIIKGYRDESTTILVSDNV